MKTKRLLIAAALAAPVLALTLILPPLTASQDVPVDDPGLALPAPAVPGPVVEVAPGAPPPADTAVGFPAPVTPQPAIPGGPGTGPRVGPSALPPTNIRLDPNTGRMTVSGRAVLTVAGEGGVPQQPETAKYHLKVIQLKHANLDSALEIFRSLLPQSRDMVAGETRTNALVIRAPQPMFDEILQLVETLDSAEPVANQTGSNLFAVRRLNRPGATSNPGVGIGGAARLGPQPGAQPGMAGAGAGVAMPGMAAAGAGMAMPGMAPRSEALTFSPPNAGGMSGGVTGTIGYEPQLSVPDLKRKYDKAERAAHDLASQIRQENSGTARLPELKHLVVQAFLARQQLLRAELKELQARIQAGQQSIELRDRVAEQIIDRRTTELLDPNLTWEPTTKTSPRPQATPAAGGPQNQGSVRTLGMMPGAAPEGTVIPVPVFGARSGFVFQEDVKASAPLLQEQPNNSSASPDKSPAVHP